MLRRIASTMLLVGLLAATMLGLAATPAAAHDAPVRNIEIVSEAPDRTAAVAPPSAEGAFAMSVLVLLAVTSALGPWLQRRSAAEYDRLQPIRVRADR